ncbi:C-type lectin domain family 4 member F-like [Lepidochelys kempii]|uniref:C-type lectin domain family 4 member F-like n=1 Tax=Lepidochelys kempii TaxID=8472 RepID=UPI003C6FF82B
MLRDQLGHVSAAYGEIQTRLDNVSAAQAAGQGRCSYVLTKLSRGWRFYGGNLYYFSQEKKPWDEAEQFCVSQDSHLTSVSSPVEQEFLSNETKGESHWIGLTDRGTEGSWRWVDGTEFRADASRGFWEENQPDNWHQETGGREDCVEIRTMEAMEHVFQPPANEEPCALAGAAWHVHCRDALSWCDISAVADSCPYAAQCAWLCNLSVSRSVTK